MKTKNVSETPAENRFRPYHVALLALLLIGTIYVAHLEHNRQDNVPFQTEEGSVFGTVYNTSTRKTFMTAFRHV